METEYITHSPDVSLPMDEPHVMAVGFFDGVHLGHQSLLQQAKAIAKKEGLKFTVMTFDPHPHEIIKQETDRRYITPLDSKLQRISAFGADKIFVVTFNSSFASIPADTFIRKYMIGLHAKHVVVGFDFTFGHKAQGDVEYLRQFSNDHSLEVTVMAKMTQCNQKISSTLIRNLIRVGDVHLIPHYLGKHYEIRGAFVESSSQSFRIDPKYVMPKPGLYQVEIQTCRTTTKGLLYCGDESCMVSSRSIVPQTGGDITVKFLQRSTLKMPVSR